MLSCPFNFESNPFLETLQQEIKDKIMHFDISYEERQHLILSNFSLLPSRAYPAATLDKLRTYCSLALFIFINDDLHDFMPRDTLAPVYDQYKAIMRGDNPTVKANWLCDLLINFRDSSKQYLSPRWHKKFGRHFAAYLRQSLRENHYRITKTYPPLDSYLAQRRLSGAIMLSFDYIEIANDLELPERLIHHGMFRDLVNTANNVSILSNDVYSLPKDYGTEAFNYAIIYKSENQSTLDEALDKLVDKYCEELQKFQSIKEELATQPFWQSHYDAYVTGLEQWIYAQWRWMAKDSTRYKLAWHLN